MTELIVADAGPLIGLARIGLLSLLRDLYGSVLIPPKVLAELQITSTRPGSEVLSAAMEEGWLLRVEVTPTKELEALTGILDPGEAEAVLLAEQRSARFLLIDERRGRLVARERGLRVVGTGGILLVAKERGLIERVAPAIEQLIAVEYRLSPGLFATLLKTAKED